VVDTGGGGDRRGELGDTRGDDPVEDTDCDVFVYDSWGPAVEDCYEDGTALEMLVVGVLDAVVETYPMAGQTLPTTMPTPARLRRLKLRFTSWTCPDALMS
jgi:hypothetical protein